jgi:hypothetical protein
MAEYPQPTAPDDDAEQDATTTPDVDDAEQAGDDDPAGTVPAPGTEQTIGRADGTTTQQDGPTE